MGNKFQRKVVKDLTGHAEGYELHLRDDKAALNNNNSYLLL